MEFIPNKFIAKQLDFSRPTFNEPNIELPTGRKPSSSADDEESSIEFDVPEVPKENQIEKVNVFLRLRPCKSVAQNFYRFNDNQAILTQHTNQTEKHFSFTSVLNSKVSQMEVYDQIVRPVLNNPFEIRGSTFGTYGISSSGKTFTMLGNDQSAGLVPRAITQIFEEYKPVLAQVPCVKIVKDQISMLDDTNVEFEINAMYEVSAESEKMNKCKMSNIWVPDDIISEHKFTVKEDIEKKIDRLYVWLSIVEIYNENIADLLSDTKNTIGKLKIFANNGNPYINGVNWLFAKDLQTAFSILSYGLRKIKYASTDINDKSSRSHTILTVNLISETNMEYQFSSFKFCDLAGAERLKKTNNVGERVKETGGINNSLLVLGRCLESIQQNQNNKKSNRNVIPVRDSKLTFYLQSSLLGQEKFVMIVNFYPTAEFLEENATVLKFASIASQIVVKNSEVRKIKRKSKRYSYLLQSSTLNSSIRNESIIPIAEEDVHNESELDDSFRWNSMSRDQLVNELHRQKMHINTLEKTYLEVVNKHTADRRDILELQRSMKEMLEKRREEEVQIYKNYYEKKMENMEIKYERKLQWANEEIAELEEELKKYRGCNDSTESDKESSEDDVIEIDD